MINAAGVMFLAPGKRALFLKRAADASDYPGFWCFPGGCSEDDETAEQTARREAREEIGKHPNLPVALHTRQVTSDFVARGENIDAQVAAVGPPLAAAASAGADVTSQPPAPAPAPRSDDALADADGHLLAVRTQTGDQIHIAYARSEQDVDRKTSCGARVSGVIRSQPVPTKIGALCVKCFHPNLPMNNVRNLSVSRSDDALSANTERARSALAKALDEGPIRQDSESSDGVDFSTFVMRVERPFLVEDLDESEHVAWAWAPADAPPQPLHPGCQISLDRLTMDELGVARAMAAGQLTSPQTYENVTLFDIRITGTETAYRKALDEYAYRHPENYLTSDFLARCNGLPVIMEHPRKAVLDSKEFSDRIVGTVFLPYVKGDEVWAIAKIYDVDAVGLMSDKDMSTSPSVVFRDPDVNTKLEMEDGSTLLIEGKPSLLDHIAICERGVWDKGGEPSGVSRSRETEAARADSVAVPRKVRFDMKKIDAVADAMAKLDARIDAYPTWSKARGGSKSTSSIKTNPSPSQEADPYLKQLRDQLGAMIRRFSKDNPHASMAGGEPESIKSLRQKIKDYRSPSN